MFFTITHKDSKSSARTGEIRTDKGVIQTPVFMPVGTIGVVKGVHFRELVEDLKSTIFLNNTYHLYLRPGTDVIEKAGGIHLFSGWNSHILTDSGGYQVYSLSEKRKISEKGVEFRSHVDGSLHFFSPETAIEIQRKIGADFIMAFDECTSYPCEHPIAAQSMEMTHRWLKRCIQYFNETSPHYGHQQYLFPIVQGSTFSDLREKSAEFIASMELRANAIGGLSVGEPAEEMYAMTEVICKILPLNKPRYLMGVGTPANLLECIALGIDMFDCVLPTRNGRNGWLFSEEGIINIKNEKWKYDYSPLDTKGRIFADKEYSKSFLRHLLLSDEILGAQVATLHNLAFYFWLMEEARKRIEDGTFINWKNSISVKLACRI